MARYHLKFNKDGGYDQQNASYEIWDATSGKIIINVDIAPFLADPGGFGSPDYEECKEAKRAAEICCQALNNHEVA